jgi:hypothetical protein
VLSFLTIEGEPTDLEQDIVDALEVSFAQFGSLTVNSRASIDTVLREHSIQTGGRFSDKSVVSIGHLSGASHVVTGIVEWSRGAVRLHVRMLDSSTGRVAAATKVSFLGDSETRSRLASRRVVRSFQGIPEVLVRPRGTLFMLSGAEYPDLTVVKELTPTTQAVTTSAGMAFRDSSPGLVRIASVNSALPMVIEFALGPGSQPFNARIVREGKTMLGVRCAPVGTGYQQLGCTLSAATAVTSHESASFDFMESGVRMSSEPFSAPTWLQIWVTADKVRLHAFKLTSTFGLSPDYENSSRTLSLAMELMPKGLNHYEILASLTRPLLMARGIEIKP